MRQIPRKFFVIGAGVFLFVLAIATFNMEGGEIITGVASLYIGSVFLWTGIQDKAPKFGAFRFRYILTGAMGIIAGIVCIVNYFF